MKTNPQIALAVRTIGQGFIALADALATPMVEGDEPTAPEAAAETPAPRKRTRTPDKPKPPIEENPVADESEAQEPEDEPAEAEEPEERVVKLVHIQEAAQALLADGKRNDLLSILKKHGIAKASVAPKEIWVELLMDLEAPLNG